MDDDASANPPGIELGTSLANKQASPQGWIFPRLKEPSVFIAAPGDLHSLRRATTHLVEELRIHAADDRALAVTNWTVDLSTDGFKDWIPVQGQIPLPSDPQCQAVICMFGERIGTPLPEDFDISPIGNTGKFATATSLVHPWKNQAATLGGFSLTGTVFELLATLHSNQNTILDDQNRGRPPLLLLFVASGDLSGDLAPIDMGWGNYRLAKEAEERFQSSHPHTWRSEYDKWRENEYLPQLAQLRNLINFLRQFGTHLRIVRDEEEALASIREFLGRSLRLDFAVESEPFLGLKTFDVADHRVFFGRKEERRQFLATFFELWADPAAPNFFGIVGSSGAGKSSMMRAGLISSLGDANSADRFQYCIVQPGDLVPSRQVQWTGDGYRKTGDPLHELLVRILEAIGYTNKLESTSQQLARTQESCRGATAVELVTALQAKEDRLLIAFDQFEELVDHLAVRSLALQWHSVIDFLWAASWHSRVGVLFTLQENRLRSLEDHPILGKLMRAGRTRDLGFPTQGLDEIITEPFLRCGIRVEPALVRELRRRFVALAVNQDSGAYDSLLPLVSVALQRIYKARPIRKMEKSSGIGANRRREIVYRGFHVKPGQFANSSNPTATVELSKGSGIESKLPRLKLAECKGLLEVGDAIAELAQEALDNAKMLSGTSWSESDSLSTFLRALVRRQGRIDRLSLPPVAVPNSVAGRHLTQTFLARRLLLPTEDGRVRVIHEALLRHWPPAAAWLAQEESLLGDSILLGLHADSWDRGGRHPEDLQADDFQKAAALLQHWTANLTSLRGHTLSAEDDRLRNYGLALISEFGGPRTPSLVSTCMFIATAYGDIPLIEKFLLCDPGAVNHVREDGRTPLFTPCFYGAEAVVSLLLTRGANPNQVSTSGRRPIDSAVEQGHVNVLASLLASGAKIDGSGNDLPTLLEKAAHFGQAEAVAFLVLHGQDPNQRSKTGYTPLLIAATRGHFAAAKVLLDHGADIHARIDSSIALEGNNLGATALHLSVVKGSADLTQLLLERGAEVNARMLVRRNPRSLAKSDSVHAEAHVRNTEIVSPLQLAIERDSVEIAWLLLAAGADPKESFPNVGTPLHLAIQQDNSQLVALLLAHGADPLFAREDGLTPLNCAQVNDDETVISLIVRYLPSEAGGHPGAIEPVELGINGRQLPWYDWIVCGSETTRPLLELIGLIDGTWQVEPARTQVSFAPLQWYGNQPVALIEITDPSWEKVNLRIYYLATTQGYHRLNGVSFAILEVNELAELALEEEDVIEYLRFFLFFVRGDEGPFYLLEDANDLLLPTYLDQGTRSRLESCVRKANLVESNDESLFVIEATVFYARAIFQITYHVHKRGLVLMTHFEPILAALPFRLQTPIT
jgi:ankyrin repeat protein